MIKKKKKLNRKGKIAFLFLIIIICGTIGGIVYSSIQSKKTPLTTKRNIIKSKKEEKVSKISLVMVGDNLIHDKIYNEAKTDDGYNFKPMYELIKKKIAPYDLAYYNQETILGGSELGVSSYPAFNSPFEVGDAMIDAGFNLVSLATNHTLDRGEKAILNSRDYWNKQKDVLAVGSYSSAYEKDKIDIREKNGIKYTMLNYTYGTNGIRVPLGKEYLVNIWPVTGSNPNEDARYQEYKNTVKNDIESTRDKVDLLMVAMHWGIEYEYEPNAYQKDMAEFLAEQGVDIIIGTHPHVIQPVTWTNNTLVIYSLGNFLSAHEVINLGNRIGLMSSIDIIKKDNKISLTNLQNELLYTYYTNNYHNFLIVPFSEMKKEYLDNYQEVYEEYKNIVQKIDKNIPVTDAS